MGYECKFCKENVPEAISIETSTRSKLTIQYACERCRDKAEKEVEDVNHLSKT